MSPSGGSGIPRIFDEFAQEHLREPQISDREDEFRITFWREPQEKRWNVRRQAAQREGVPVTDVTDEIETDVTDITDVTDDVEKKIQQMLRKDAHLSQAKIAEHLRMSKRNVTRYMNKMQKEGVLKRVGNVRTGKWEVK